MISQVSKDIAIGLFEANLECYRVINEICDRLRPSYLTKQLRDLADTYIRNNQDLNTLFQLGGTERLLLDRPESHGALSGELQEELRFGDSVAVLREVLVATSRVRRAYREGIEDSRELSEKLPHQFARADRGSRIARSLFNAASDLQRNANSSNN